MVRGGRARGGALVRFAGFGVVAEVEQRQPEPLFDGADHRILDRLTHHRRDVERLAAVVHDRMIGVSVRRLVGGARVIMDRAPPVVALVEVVRECLVVLGQPVGVQFFDRHSDNAVQLPAPFLADTVIRDVVGEGVLEHVRQLGVHRLFVDQLESAQLFDLCVDVAAALGDPLQQAQRKLAADHRGDLYGAARLVGQPIDAGDEHVLDGVGDL